MKCNNINGCNGYFIENGGVDRTKDGGMCQRYKCNKCGVPHMEFWWRCIMRANNGK